MSQDDSAELGKAQSSAGEQAGEWREADKKAAAQALRPLWLDDNAEETDWDVYCAACAVLHAVKHRLQPQPAANEPERAKAFADGIWEYVSDCVQKREAHRADLDRLLATLAPTERERELERELSESRRYEWRSCARKVEILEKELDAQATELAAAKARSTFAETQYESAAAELSRYRDAERQMCIEVDYCGEGPPLVERLRAADAMLQKAQFDLAAAKERIRETGCRHAATLARAEEAESELAAANERIEELELLLSNARERPTPLEFDAMKRRAEKAEAELAAAKGREKELERKLDLLFAESREILERAQSAEVELCAAKERIKRLEGKRRGATPFQLADNAWNEGYNEGLRAAAAAAHLTSEPAGEKLSEQDRNDIQLVLWGSQDGEAVLAAGRRLMARFPKPAPTSAGDKLTAAERALVERVCDTTDRFPSPVGDLVNIVDRLAPKPAPKSALEELLADWENSPGPANTAAVAERVREAIKADQERGR